MGVLRTRLLLQCLLLHICPRQLSLFPPKLLLLHSKSTLAQDTTPSTHPQAGQRRSNCQSWPSSFLAFLTAAGQTKHVCMWHCCWPRIDFEMGGTDAAVQLLGLGHPQNTHSDHVKIAPSLVISYFCCRVSNKCTCFTSRKSKFACWAFKLILRKKALDFDWRVILSFPTPFFHFAF